MSFTRTTRTATSCFEQEMERGNVDGNWTTYAIGPARPCNDSLRSSNGNISPKTPVLPPLFVSDRLQSKTMRPELQEPKYLTKTNPEEEVQAERPNMAPVFISVVVIAIAYFIWKS
jgi:hypothetical protein